MVRTLLFVLLSVLLSACIKDAPLNPEADIETFVFDPVYKTGETFIDQANNKIIIYLTRQAYQNGLQPVVTVSKGASLSPASGDSIHFNKTIRYTVTSESGEYKKVYDLVVVHDMNATSFGFEKWAQHPSDKYEFPLETDGTQLWSSGNPGAAIAGLPKDPGAYPTRSTSDYYAGTRAAELVTIKGTPLTELVGIKLLPGSLFYGNFNSQNALANPPLATEFGQPFEGLPQSFSGYYKYSPGPLFQDKSGNTIAGESDSCSIYAVLFKGPERLNGTTILSSNKIVAKAILKDKSAKSHFTRFEIAFDYVPGADLSGDLMLAIVASSSHKGDQYAGAIGSRLILDELTILKK